VSEAVDIVIRDLRPEDREAALDVLIDAFLGFEFPPSQLIFGTGEGAPARARGLYGMLFEPRSKASVVVAERDSRIVGVLTYADNPDCVSMSPGQALTMGRIMGPRLLASARLLFKASRAHPKAPHRHLPVMGVDPGLQGQGIGGLLIAEFERRCDEAGLEGYVETVSWADTTKPSHRKLYERHGFAVTHVLPRTKEWSLLLMTRPVGGSAGV